MEAVEEARETITPVEDDDDLPTLSSHTLEALKQFLSEQTQVQVDDDANSAQVNDKEVSLVTENWNLSQFWYDQETAETIAKEVLHLSQLFDSPYAACVACPTLYAYIKKIDPNAHVQLLEYDTRFQKYGNEFTFYDYNQPEELPSPLKNAFQVLIADPPYLSKECLEKVAQTISFLKQNGKCYILLLTGEVQKDRAAELLDLHPCGFRPRHSSKLGNEFRLYTSYDPETRLGGWERD
ncbi:EEF1A lysine methyltransferase 1 [Impatiens glandulifera]|uniref:EEF1A lysine methyltransferase 1 n=1 Tax=Impatiens glandulifera TaxID=253017 RepID=UPI001FB142DA|nr:EEF1A lysine methyltransferase 1 [Impatiens glandulifera]